MELRSAIHEDRDTNLCRVEIINDGTSAWSGIGHYDVRLYARNNGRLIRTARVENWPRNTKAAWRLLAAAMESLSQ